MLIGRFKSNEPHLYVLLVFLAFILWIDGFFGYRQVSLEIESAAPLYKPIALFFNQHRFWSVLLSFLMMILQAFMLNRIVCDKNLVDRNSHLPALIYIVLMSTSFNLFGLHPVWFANLFLLIALEKVFGVFGEDEVFLEIFNVAFFVSIASLFYLAAFWFVIFVFAALIVYYLFNPRGILASLIGFVTPYLFLALYYFWYDLLAERLDNLIELQMPFAFLPVKITPYAVALFIVIGFISVVALIKTYLGYVLDKPVRIRKRYQALFVFLLVAVVSGLFANDYIDIHYALIMLPLAGIVAGFYQHNKNMFWNEFLFTMLLLLILVGKLARLD